LTKIRVGVDGRAFASPAPGVRRYAAGLVGALLQLGEPLEIVALGGCDVSAIPARVGHVPEPRHPPTNLGWALVGLPRAARRAHVDLIHAPAYTAPLWAGVPIALTIHDVSYERHPEWYPYRRDWLRRTFYRRSALAAAQILTVSEFSASEIAAAYGIPHARITTAPLGVDGRFVPADPALPCELPAGVRSPFLLHVGDLHERRNLGVVVEALLAARQRHEGATHASPLPPLSLVLAGIDRGVGRALCAMAAAADAPDAVVLLGAVSDDRLAVLYRCATALVYPSLYEGFGLPLLEAMASGTPVIASSAASIPEVVGDAGVLIDPLDSGAWSDAIGRVVNDESVRARMRTKGLARAAQFTWERTARITWDVYRRAIEHST
jgi:glycosyltransferase involved in cell wall biosynthesis